MTTTGKPKFGAVAPHNVRPSTGPSRRRDPDAAETPAPPASTAPTPPTPTDPTPPPPPAAPEPVPAAQPVNTPAVQPPPPAAGGGTLASVLTAPNHRQHPSVSEGVAALAGLAGMAARPVDPLEDWGADGTRTPRWLAAAVRQYAVLTGRKTQEVQRDALLGVRPIPDDVLDAQWLHHYGYPREQYRPEDYR